MLIIQCLDIFLLVTQYRLKNTFFKKGLLCALANHYETVSCVESCKRTIANRTLQSVKVKIAHLKNFETTNKSRNF